ncbi:hypothetical protein O181_033197 [Austropuccinia psidii MF-1]|uniref:Uncharacterized protein n=1 Tax=Austropuccinia psidii MF-1 TaxID=1389203 RepID=A0A9Q3H6Y2_9BASI|nr:hypothetical protein [Austropuccinia psidii MF-1]
MPEPQSTDVGGAEGEAAVSSVSLELMAKDCARRRIQGIRIMHSKPESFVDESTHNPVMTPQNWAQSITHDIPFNIGEGNISYCHGPYRWAQAIWVKKWSHGPLETQSMGKFWPWGTPIAPKDCRPQTVGHHNYPKRPKRPLITVP